MAAVGAVGFGVGRAVSEVARYVGAHNFVDAADKTNSAATDALSPTATLVGQLIWETSALALGFAIAIISLNAMRVGLLSRFMGVLGVIVGVAVAPILPIDQQGIIRVFWLAALGVLFLGRWRNMPKAWATGEAEPWPTQQQLREQRQAARGQGEPSEPDAPRRAGAARRPRRRRPPRARDGRIPPPRGPSTARRRRRSASAAPERCPTPDRRPDRHAVGVDRGGQHEISTSNREGISWKRAPPSQSGASSRRAPLPPAACSSSPARSRIPARWASPPSR